MLKLGTHNSMTYLKPTGLVQILAWNTGKCQNLSLEEQYEFGVRFFDLRIRFVEGGLELLKSPTFFAMQNNPNYWKNVNEDVYTMMDFVQLGAPEEYLSQLPVDLQKRIKVLFEKLPQLPK